MIRIAILPASCLIFTFYFPGTVLLAQPPLESDDFTNTVGMRFVRIPPGEFLMGSPPEEPGRLDNVGPRHRVRITRSFYLGTHEVTVGDFRRFVEETGYRTETEKDLDGGFGIDWQTGKVIQANGIGWRQPGFPGFRQTDRHPVLFVSWEEAETFLE